VEQKTDWTRTIIPIFITGIVMIAVGIIVGLSLNHFQMREPKLVYYVEDTIPYQSPTGDTAIYHVKIENLGKEAAEEVICILAFEKANIEQYRIIIDPSINYSESVLSNSYRVDLPSLNPKESATLSVLATSNDKLPARPEISLRGNGIVGSQATSETGKQSPWPATAGILASIVAGSASIFYFVRRGVNPFNPLNVNQKYTLAYLCEIHGLGTDAERYRAMVADVMYWSESDRIAALALREPNSEEANNRKNVLEALLESGIVKVKASNGIIHYNIARIAKAQGDEKEVEKHLNIAKKNSGNLVNQRLKLDPIWRNK
jgi:hypothetical protein